MHDANKSSANGKADDGHAAPVRSLADLPAAAQRALQEAAERRARQNKGPELPPEIEGRGGPEPVRYGDWERKGLISDF